MQSKVVLQRILVSHKTHIKADLWLFLLHASSTLSLNFSVAMAKLVEKAKKIVEEKVADVKKPEAWVTDMDLADFCSDAITYTAKVAVKNPYSSPIPICQISYSFKSKGRLSSFTSLSLSLSLYKI